MYKPASWKWMWQRAFHVIDVRSTNKMLMCLCDSIGHWFKIFKYFRPCAHRLGNMVAATTTSTTCTVSRKLSRPTQRWPRFIKSDNLNRSDQGRPIFLMKYSMSKADMFLLMGVHIQYNNWMHTILGYIKSFWGRHLTCGAICCTCLIQTLAEPEYKVKFNFWSVKAK